MKILGKQPSREKCAESGWFATDYLLDAPIDRAFILSLRPLGSFVYLDMLKEPFFKIENDYYMIKGVQGKDYFRIAVHGKHEDELDVYKRQVESRMNPQMQYGGDVIQRANYALEHGEDVLSACVRTVSYTHLDVYKRQAVYHYADLDPGFPILRSIYPETKGDLSAENS